MTLSLGAGFLLSRQISNNHCLAVRRREVPSLHLCPRQAKGLSYDDSKNGHVDGSFLRESETQLIRIHLNNERHLPSSSKAFMILKLIWNTCWGTDCHDFHNEGNCLNIHKWSTLRFLQPTTSGISPILTTIDVDLWPLWDRKIARKNGYLASFWTNSSVSEIWRTSWAGRLGKR